MKKNLYLIIPAIIIGVLSIVILLIPNKRLDDNSNNMFGDTNTYFNSNNVSYDNTSSILISSNIQDAIEEVYQGILSDCYIGYSKGNILSTSYTCTKDNSSKTSSQTDFIGSNVSYDNSSGLMSNNLQGAIDELLSHASYCNIDYHKENETSNSYDCIINIIQCETPTNVSISTQGIVTWTESNNCSSAQHQISIDGVNFTNATSGIDYNNIITGSAGEKTIYVRALAPNSDYSDSLNATSSIDVYSVNLTAGDGVSSVTGSGNYISGSTVTINATLSDHYIWSDWSGTPATTTQNYSATINEDWTLTANTTNLCSTTQDRPTCVASGSCSVACSDGQGGTRPTTCTHKYYSTVSGYTNHLCSTGSTYSGSSVSCTGTASCYSEWQHEATWTLQAEKCNAQCPSICPGRGKGYSTWRCFDGDPGYPPDKREHIYGGYQCWCR